MPHLPSYVINPGDHPSITCRLCGMTSWSREDVGHAFCGNCKVFHNDLGTARTPMFIINYLGSHPGCVRGLYPESDHHQINEDDLFTTGWVPEEGADGDEICWVNESVPWADGIRFIYEGGKVTFEEI